MPNNNNKFCPAPCGGYFYFYIFQDTMLDTLAGVGYGYLMTRKHFEAIAATNKARVEHYSTTERDRIILYTLIVEQADVFATFNPNFDRDRFLTACGF